MTEVTPWIVRNNTAENMPWFIARGHIGIDKTEYEFHLAPGGLRVERYYTQSDAQTAADMLNASTAPVAALPFTMERYAIAEVKGITMLPTIYRTRAEATMRAEVMNERWSGTGNHIVVTVNIA